MGFEVITYATHSERMFPRLMNSGYPIRVLGFGEKWESFLTKIKGVLAYVKTKRPDDIIVCIDAFDVVINDDPSKAERIFKEMGCGFLVSLDPGNHLYELKFGTCKGNETANMGLWMGYAKYIVPILEDIIARPCDDDQINFNALCSTYDYIAIDTEKKIFHNTFDKTLVTESIFIGFPASVNLHDSIGRFFTGGLPFFFLHVTLLFYVVFTLFPRVRIPLGTLYAFLLFWFVFKSNKTCLRFFRIVE